MKLLFDDAAFTLANGLWHVNCGPGSLAAALALDLETVRQLMPEFEGKGYTNPTMIEQALGRAGIVFRRTKGLVTDVLCEGINRVQWSGPWLKPGVPAGAAYQRTHWVAAAQGMVFCTCSAIAWIPLAAWRAHMHTVCSTIPRCDGWHVTHHYAFDVLAKEAA
jgi:hypothetical protein